MLDYENLNLPVVKVHSLKHNNRVDKAWTTKKLDETNELIVLLGVFEKEVKHSHLGVIRPNTISFEYYWKNFWFNVFEFHEPDGGLRNFYCNVSQPPVSQNRELRYVDLDLDVLVLPNLSYQVLDRDEFDINAKKHFYSNEMMDRAQQALSQIIKRIEEKQFPFDQSFSNLFFSENKIIVSQQF